MNPSVAKTQDDVDDEDVDAPDAAASEPVAPAATSESVAPNPHAFLSSKSIPAAVATDSCTEWVQMWTHKPLALLL